MKYAFYAVDELEGQTAILFGDDGSRIEVPLSELPQRLREGSVLRVRVGVQNLPDWSSAVIDPKEQHRRLREAEDTLKEMKDSDPGGDITL